MKRRDFIKKTLPMGLGIAAGIPILRGSAFGLQPNARLNALANADEQNDRILVIIFLDGGNDGLNTLVPFTDTTYHKFRKNTGFVSQEDISRLTRKLSPTLAFNPFMGGLADLFDEGKVAAVQNVGLFNPDLSHFRATDIWNHACDHDQILNTGWIGRWSEELYPEYPDEKPRDPIAIAMGAATSDAFQGARSSVEVLVKDPSERPSLGDLDPIAQFYGLGSEEARYLREVMQISDFYGKRFSELFPDKAKNLVEYPASKFAQDMRKISWCITSGLSTKIYFVELAGFDTHYFQSSKELNPNSHAVLLRDLSDGILAFQRDMEAFGLDHKVTMMTYSEFGRRAFENGGLASGTDHGTAAPHFVIGSQVNGGLYGPNPNLEVLDANGDPFIDFEFRQMYASVMGDWFGLSKETQVRILSPGRDRDPFETTFPLNDGSGSRPLLRPYVKRVDPAIQKRYSLHGAYPNPASFTTRLSFDLDRASHVSIELFDARAVRVKTLVNSKLPAGRHTPEFDVSKLPTGHYIYRLTVDGVFETQRLNIIR